MTAAGTEPAGAPVRVEGETESGEPVVSWYFPVEVEVRTDAPAIDADALVERTLARLADGLSGIA
jgi:hypothetical protein